ncbi:hypothetical protein NECAME_13552 [Necator americanus]|uniref:Uncharacterized protein n=1 Tax=Necator americanus TaxID=51031 RepID=W2SXN9_NECAM|nr:hypothetical protein NECAME_13552 [Necator americanus]ETN73372.1 hypothetical protein NECAME_13552 [Necator americanus]
MLGIYGPLNSRNTLFHRRAFFTLFLPVSVKPRVMETIRSYFAQKLLHIIGENIALHPANAVQMTTSNDQSVPKTLKSLHNTAESPLVYLCPTSLLESFAGRALEKAYMQRLQQCNYSKKSIKTTQEYKLLGINSVMEFCNTALSAFWSNLLRAKANKLF